MGTFHDTKDPLHGVTVVAVIQDRVYVGRCHERSDATVLLLDADEHSEGQDGKTNAEYLARAARFGVWGRHERLTLPAAEISTITPLSQHYRRPGSDAVPEISRTVNDQAAAPVQTSAQTASPTPASTTTPIMLTDGAVTEVKRLLAQEQNESLGLRLGVSGGGCSGLVYKSEFSELRDGDLVVAQDGFEVYLDRKSTIYLRDVTLDFQPGLAGKGFQFNNPNASNTCGCGESFTV